LPDIIKDPKEAGITRNAKQIRKDPPMLLSLGLGVFLLFLIYGGGFLFVTFWTGSYSELQNFIVWYQLCAMLTTTVLAVSGSDTQNKGCSRYIGIFLLSIIPVVGWIVIYWAGKSIARWLTESDAGATDGKLVLEIENRNEETELNKLGKRKQEALERRNRQAQTIMWIIITAAILVALFWYFVTQL